MQDGTFMWIFKFIFTTMLPQRTCQMHIPTIYLAAYSPNMSVHMYKFAFLF